MIRFSKPLGRLLDFKQVYFNNNSKLLEYCNKIGEIYKEQPRREVCKNCNCELDYSENNTFENHSILYCICSKCTHCNGAYQDTEEYSKALYSGDMYNYFAQNYSDSNYNKRVSEVYVPKAEFLRQTLDECNENITELADFGAGAGFFLSAASQCGFEEIVGYEPSKPLCEIGNSKLKCGVLNNHEFADTVNIISNCTSPVISLIGVLEHLQNPREVLSAIKNNDNIKYAFFLLPMFSPSVVVESVFSSIMPRLLSPMHTHLYSEKSIEYMCDEYGFEMVSQWWFGLDICDLLRSVSVSLHEKNTSNKPLEEYWQNSFVPLVDKLQAVVDEAKICSDLHFVIRKK